MEKRLNSGEKEAVEYQRLISQFKKLEYKHNLFDICVDDFHPWEWLRFPVTRKVLVKKGVLSTPHSQVDRDLRAYLKGFKDWLTYSYYRNPIFGSETDVLFYGISRRKPWKDDRWWDIYCDPVMEFIDHDTAMIERPHVLNHFTPTPTDTLYYLDFVYYAPEIVELLSIRENTFSPAERAAIEQLERPFREELNVEIDIEAMVRSLLTERRVECVLYRRILERMSPELAIIVCSYGKETFIEVCKSAGIPVAELQHGAIHPDHFGFSFPGERTKRTFPDYLLTFGEYWREYVEFPVDDDRIIPVGFPYFEEEAARHADTPTKNQIIVYSQGPMGEILSSFAVELSKRESFDCDIVYKLHPGEYDRWRSAYPNLQESSVQVVDSDDQSLYELIAESRAQVGVNSTVLYEGLCFDLDTYILAAPMYTTMEGIFSLDSVRVVHDVDGFLQDFPLSGASVDTSRFFEPNALQNIESAIQDILLASNRLFRTSSSPPYKT